MIVSKRYVRFRRQVKYIANARFLYRRESERVNIPMENITLTMHAISLEYNDIAISRMQYLYINIHKNAQ